MHRFGQVYRLLQEQEDHGNVGEHHSVGQVQGAREQQIEKPQKSFNNANE